MIHYSGSPKVPYCIIHLALLTVFESGRVGFERCGWAISDSLSASVSLPVQHISGDIWIPSHPLSTLFMCIINQAITV